MFSHRERRDGKRKGVTLEGCGEGAHKVNGRDSEPARALRVKVKGWGLQGGVVYFAGSLTAKNAKAPEGYQTKEDKA